MTNGEQQSQALESLKEWATQTSLLNLKLKIRECLERYETLSEDHQYRKLLFVGLNVLGAEIARREKTGNWEGGGSQ